MKSSYGFAFISHLVMVGLLSPAFAQTAASQPAPSALVLEDGTPVKLRISRTVSSADAHVGDTVDFEVLEEIKVGSLLVVPKGGTAWGTVTEAESKKRMARGGKLNMNIDSVRLVDGEKVALRAIKEVKGGGHTGAMTGGIVATAIVFWPAAPFFLFMHGKDITVPKGTEITAYINGNSPLDLAKFQAAAQPAVVASAIAPAPSAASPGGTATLDVSSTPPDADIEIDGSFAGDTPSSVGIAPGDHTVRITKKGFTPWEKKIHSSTGNVRMTAELEPSTVPTAAPAGSPAASPVVVAQQPASTSVAPQAASQPAAQQPAPAATSTPKQITVSIEPQLRPAVMKSTEAVAATATPTQAAPASAQVPPAEKVAAASNAEGMASITSDPDKAEIFVDSVGQGHTPALLKLKPGKHKVQLVADGYKDWVGEVEVKAGSTVNVTGKLEK